VLGKSRYYDAIGSVTDAALSRVLQDVLELDDIPELESHRLSELCRILNALEGLFCEDPEQVWKILNLLCLVNTLTCFKLL
jgi:protein transport protein DSL1/ZW10